MISVPCPAKLAAWNPETIRCPGFDAFGVIDIEELNVPAEVTAVAAGTITAGLKSTLRSKAITPNPVRSPTVIGSETAPGVAVTAGSDTGTPDGVPAGVAVFVDVAELVGVSVAVFVGVLVAVLAAVVQVSVPQVF